MSQFTQASFKGGMDLLSDDTRIAPDKYRIGFNLRNRYDVIEPTLSSKLDINVPYGIIQELVTFGNYLVLFVSGAAYYRYYTSSGWKQIVGFQMSQTAPRYWTKQVPVAIANFGRFAVPLATVDNTGTPIAIGDQIPVASGGITLNSIASANEGDLPGLIVQDGVSQPQFIFLTSTGLPSVRTIQTYDEWSFTANPETLVITEDKREYVPVGTSMAWTDGILYVTSPDGERIYRSVSGRPLDFVVAVDISGNKTGDAEATAYSVGVGGIRCLREMSNGAVFVAASNANFIVSKNMTDAAPRLFGEYTFIRTFLFNATCLSDRVILDSLGDTKFIDLTGVRSFNAIQQLQNEGRNSQFTATIQSAFAGIIQNASSAAALLYDNYEFYAVNTIFGPAIVVYDTINGCWTSFDLEQTGGEAVKILAKIELDVQRLFAVTESNKLYTLYIGEGYDTPKLVPVSASPLMLKDEQGYQTSAKGEIKLTEVRCVFNKITSNTSVTVTPYVNNRMTKSPATAKQITYSAPTYPSTENIPGVDTQLSNVLFSFPDCGQGWKAFCVIEWSGSGVLTQFTYDFVDVQPMNPLLSQANTR